MDEIWKTPNANAARSNINRIWNLYESKGLKISWDSEIASDGKITRVVIKNVCYLLLRFGDFNAKANY